MDGFLFVLESFSSGLHNMNLKSTKLLSTLLPFILGLIIILALVSCGPADSNLSSNSLTAEAYPVSHATPTPFAYPVDPVPTRMGTLLAFDRPINPNQTIITGVGPAGLRITILNITFLGEELGSGVIENNGTFSLNVNPVPAGVRIGLTADLAASEMTDDDVRPGEGEMSTPRVGYFFDSVVIPQQN